VFGEREIQVSSVALEPYFGYKFIKNTKIIPLSEIPVQHFIEIANAKPEVPAKSAVGWRRLNIIWS
jgi:amino acid transporter